MVLVQYGLISDPFYKKLKKFNTLRNYIKFMFSMMSQPPNIGKNAFLFCFCFPYAEWKSDHGKGVPDAVGGSLKQKANSKVMFGCNITTAKTFVDSVSGGETEISIIEE